MSLVRRSLIRVVQQSRFALAQAVVRVPRALYHKNVVDHYENPRNVGTLDSKADDVGTGLVGAPACGDVMRLQVRISDDGKIQEAKFKTFGCGSAIASSSYTTSWLEGKSVDEALKLKNSDIASHLALPPVKIHCSMLAEDATKAALADWKKKQAAKKAKKQQPATEEKKATA